MININSAAVPDRRSSGSAVCEIISKEGANLVPEGPPDPIAFVCPANPFYNNDRFFE
jgi:hypothetical protein